MELNIRTTQPIDTEYEFQTRLEILDLDKERERGIVYGRDFLLETPRLLRKISNQMHLSSPVSMVHLS